MNLTMILHFIEQYGLLIVFLVVLLEYLNIPGLPAGVIIPFSGVWAAQKHIFIMTLVVTIIAGILGSMLLYFVGKYGGTKFINFCIGKSERARRLYEKLKVKIDTQGSKAIFISKLLPVVRTIIGIPAGAMGMKFSKYIVASAMGICIWNSVLFSAGYFFGIGANMTL